jgi:hypothetical protein
MAQRLPKAWPYLVFFSLGVMCVTISEYARFVAGVEESLFVSVLGRIAIGLSVVGWILADARRRRESICYDFDTMAFVAWPVAVPVYFVYTRRWRCLPMVGMFLALYLGSWLVGYAICGVALAFAL